MPPVEIGPEPFAYRFDAALAPMARVRPGERLVIRTPDGMGGRIRTASDRYLAVDPERVNPVVGPIAVEGAERGDVLAVDLHSVTTDAAQGYVLVIPGFGLLRHRGWEATTRIVPLEGGQAVWEGVRIPLRPCLGTIGVAPAGEGVPTIMPGDHGGNLDTADVATGATIYFPVRVAGALLAMGDPKAAMGDGEVCGTGIGVPVRVEATCRLLRGVPLRRPLLETPAAWATIASAPTLDEACRLATEDMVDLLAATRDPAEAYMLLSVAGNLRVSQVVDPLMTARMEIGKEYVGRLVR